MNELNEVYADYLDLRGRVLSAQLATTAHAPATAHTRTRARGRVAAVLAAIVVLVAKLSPRHWIQNESVCGLEYRQASNRGERR